MYINDKQDRVCQGELYRNLIYLEFIDEKKSLDVFSFPFALIFTQECDLKWDYEGHNGGKKKYNQYLNSILCCPAYPSTELREGTHLYEIEGKEEYKMREFVPRGKKDNTSWNQVKQNSDPRYHYLQTFEVDGIVIPELVLDFKHYYSIPRDLFYLRKENAEYIARLNVPFRELVSQRFAYFLSRVGLPELETKKIDCNSNPCHTD